LKFRTAGVSAENKYHVSHATLFAESPVIHENVVHRKEQEVFLFTSDRQVAQAAQQYPAQKALEVSKEESSRSVNMVASDLTSFTQTAEYTERTITDSSPDHLSVASKRVVNHSILSDSRVSPLPKRNIVSSSASQYVDDSQLSNHSQQNSTEPSIELDPLPSQRQLQKTNDVIPRPQQLRIIETVRPAPVSAPVVIPQRSYPQQQNSSFAHSETDISIDFAGVSFGRPVTRGRHERRAASVPSAPITNSAFLKSTKINSPLKVPRAAEQTVQHAVVTSVAANRQYVASSTRIVDEKISYIAQGSILSSGIKSGSCRVPAEEYVDLRPEDYDEEITEEDEVFQFISEEESSCEDDDEDEHFDTANNSIPRVISPPNIRAELLMTAKKPKGSAVTSIATQCTPSLVSGPHAVAKTLKASTGSIPQPLTVDIKDVNFEVSDDSSDEGEPVNRKSYTPKSQYTKERLDESGEFGLEELLMSAKSRDSVASTLTKTAYSAFTDRGHNSFRCRMDSSSPNTIRSGARRVQADFEQEDDTDRVDYSESTKVSMCKYADRTAEFYEDGEVDSENVIAASDMDLNNSAMFTAATTLSLDSDNQDVSIDDCEVPRIAITRRQRSFKDSSDVKEIVVAGAVGVETTIVLTFANRRDKVQKLYAKTVQMRFDSNNSLVPKNFVAKSPKLTPGGNNLGVSAFDVHPRCVRMEPNSDATLYVSFLPTHSGIYGGVLKIRTNKKSFVMLLRGEAAIDTPAKEKMSRSITFDSILDKSIQRNTASLMKSPMKRPVEVIEKSPEQKVVSRREDVQSPQDSLPVGQFDPLVLRQKWLREWLSRATQRQSAMIHMVPAITTIAKHTGALPLRSQSVPSASHSASACISVIPSSLRLLPQRKAEMGQYGEYFVNTGFLQGSLLVRNFSQHNLEIGVATSSESILVQTSKYAIPAHDAVSVVIEFDPSVARQKISSASPEDPHGGLVGYVMISSSVGEEFVVDVKMPPQSCLSPNVGIASRAGDELRANSSLREFVNADTMPLFKSCVNAFQNSSVVHNIDASIVEMGKIKSPLMDSSPQDSKLLQRKRERAIARGREVFAKTQQKVIARSEEKIDILYSKVDLQLNNTRASTKILGDNDDHQHFSTLLNATTKSILEEPSVVDVVKREPEVTPRKVMSPLRYPNSYKKLEASPKPQRSPRTPRRPAASLSFAPHDELIRERDRAVNSGVFFRKLIVDFGSQEMGSLTRQKIDLCNSTDQDMVVLITDPSLPFVTLHNEIHLKANSYVRLPIRFVPVSKATFEVDLVGTVESTGEKIRIVLSGQGL